MRERVAREGGAEARSMVTGWERVREESEEEEAEGKMRETTTWTEKEPQPLRTYLNGGELRTTWGGEYDSGRKSSTEAIRAPYCPPEEEAEGRLTEMDHLIFAEGSAPVPRERFLTAISAMGAAEEGDEEGGGRGLNPHTMHALPTRSSGLANVQDGHPTTIPDSCSRSLGTK